MLTGILHWGSYYTKQWFNRTTTPRKPHQTQRNFFIPMSSTTLPPTFCHQASHSSFLRSDRCCRVCYWPAWVTTGTNQPFEPGELGDSNFATFGLIIIFILTVHWLPVRLNHSTSWLQHWNLKMIYANEYMGWLQRRVACKMQAIMEKTHHLVEQGRQD